MVNKIRKEKHIRYLHEKGSDCMLDKLTVANFLSHHKNYYTKKEANYRVFIKTFKPLHI